MAELIFVSIGFCIFALGIAMGIALAGYVVITGQEEEE